MWGINDVFLLLAIIYLALGLTVGIFLSMRKRKRKSAQLDHKKVQSATTISQCTYIVNGRYEMRSPPFKQGGMATIWLAAERKTGKACIIKTPRRGTIMDNVYLDKLMLEASYLRKLKHPGIVNYFDHFYYKGEFHLVIGVPDR